MKFNSFFTLLLFTAFAFVACDNEPLEGDFVSDDPQDFETSFTADVEGAFFEADTTNAVLPRLPVYAVTAMLLF